MAKPGALKTLDDNQAIVDLINGYKLQDIADRYGCDKSAVYRRLVKHPDYADAIKQQADTWAREAVAETMTCADDQVNIARARADVALRYARVRHPDYADKQQIDHHITVDLGAKLRQAELAIDGQCTIDASAADYVKLEDK